MSKLYIRVRTSFYTHRKTLRLKAAIGDAAFWVPPRIWAYAADNQPDGNFDDYTPQEIAAFIGYTGDAKEMLQAMLQARLFDSNPLRIHDWYEHNGYHEKYAERARNAATARWSKEKPPTPPKEEIGNRKEDSGDKHCSSIAQALLQASGERILPSLQQAERWLDNWKLSGADYTMKETQSAFLSLQANGWMWGKNPVVDFRAALERQIQTDRTHNERNKTSGGNPAQHIDRAVGTANEGLASQYKGLGRLAKTEKPQ